MSERLWWIAYGIGIVVLVLAGLWLAQRCAETHGGYWWCW